MARLFHNPFLSRSHLHIGGFRLLDLTRLSLRSGVPDFALIGAGKAGSTSLARALDQHPDIFMTKPYKEPEFFCPPERIRTRRRHPVASRERLLRAFMLKGYAGERLIGDASTYYTAARRDFDDGTPANMRALSPDIRLIYLLRNPHVRFVSHIRQDVKTGHASGPLGDFMAQKCEAYTDQGRYFFQIERYLAQFPPDRLHVVILEELLQAPEPGLAALFDFLGLPPDARAAGTLPKANISAQGPREEEALYRSTFMAQTAPHFREDKKRLEAFLGRPITVWDLDSPFGP